MRQFKSTIAFFFAAISLLAFQNTFATPEEDAILIQVNNYRASYGLPALPMHPQIQAVARAHSANLATKSLPIADLHVGFSQRVTQLKQYFNNPSLYVTENVAWHTGSSGAAAALWFTSSGHIQNILGTYTATGVGVVYGNGRYHVTQIFVR